MLRRTRTAKKLAQRIDLNYFQRPHRFRRWRLLLSVSLPLLALLWLGWQGAAGQQELYTSGPVSAAHAVFGDRCEVCHVTQAGVFRRHVTDQACLVCHDGPIHQDEQVFTPPCGACHVEHKGALRLAHTDDWSCTQCHAGLQTKSGSSEFELVVEGFNTGHPEFAVLRSGRGDPGTIKLNHEAHLRPDLRGPTGPVQLECASCHRPPGASAPWPYGEAQFQTVAASAEGDVLAAVPTSAYMAPIEYAKHCVSCHPLQFDERFADTVPHKEPKVVYEFLLAKYRQYIARHPAELRHVPRRTRRLPGKPPPAPPRTLTPARWVAQRVAEAEQLLWRKTCKECHALRDTGGALPEVAEPAIPVRWLPQAEFDHEPHRLLACTACHAGTASSKETADVLLPGIETCQQCHRPVEAAEARCFECHRYHDWSRARRVTGPYTIPDLLRGAANERRPAAPVGGDAGAGGVR